ncbi:hypothetical protein SDC9_90946 [bioreactor metagenome]|uniref:DUF2877 domain-containing protein n=1 Tax=bioreactor metagenome TaxID=1076179 RepID=A0A644ZV17_9ZZZZ
MERGEPKLTLTADAVCSRLLKRMREKPVTATVHSVFDHAVNLAFENRTGLVGLIAGEKTLTPYAVSVQTPCSFTELGFRAGMAAAVQAETIELPEAGLSIDCSAAESIDLGIGSLRFDTPDGLKQALPALRQTLEQSDAEVCLAPLVTGGAGNVYTKFLAPRLEELVQVVTAGDAERAASAAANTAGCGMGLTPSSDDLLTGYFAGLHTIFRTEGKAERISLIPIMAQRAAEKTNRISATFLLQSGEGLVNYDLLALLQTIVTGADIKTIQQAAQRVLSIGSTSGGDMLTGLSLALAHHAGGK